MLELFGRPIVEYVLAGLAAVGIRHATVNAGWLAEAFAGLPEAGHRIGIDTTLSIQERPLEHGGDLAFATTFLGSLDADEVFVAVNGDTIVDIDPFIHDLAATVTAEAPVLLLGHRAPEGPLGVQPNGHLSAIGDVTYAPTADLLERWDDAGLKLIHASVRDFLPEPGTVMSLHGHGGLLGRLAAAGKTIRVAEAPIRARFEIGTLDEYRALAVDPGLRELTGRLMRTRASPSR